ncbi:carboxypeptidase-like regulatory domain-containing protein [Phyllobacterium endophyticum]|uniref:carboxypeptidase-like regulatory domain-containing protein n=1 Tax=Phyllobacterium endophyticum TaxID=1149773 RepID=UPI0011C74192|nr:carboxypeptidase-like regulatory domain-containing protein [Phyllobacterium endophyticum]TXR48454.1 carboxypeptidase regulatory-like domain-containing protein [Phyllobacterium endophyticum]
MSTDGFATIIGSINTPLALAALSLLIIGSILYVAAKDGRERPILVRYGFGVSALFGLLAIGGFMADSYMNEVFLVEGNVTDETGRSIEGAVVDIVGLGRSISLSDGTFIVPMSRKKVQSVYNVRVRKAGFEDWTGPISGPYPKFIEINTPARQFTQKDVHITSDGMVSVYLGVGEFLTGVQALNNTSRAESFQTLAMRLTSPLDKIIELSPDAILNSSNGTDPFTTLTVGPLSELSQRIIWRDDAAISNAKMVARDSGLLAGPKTCIPGRGPVEKDLAIEKFFDQNFFWEEGVWKGAFTMTTDRAKVSKAFSFVLSKSQVAVLHGSKLAYLQCRGLEHGNHYFSDAGAKSLLPVNFELVD